MSDNAKIKVKKYNFSRPPKRANLFLMWIARMIAHSQLKGFNLKIDKVNMEGLKPPYLLLGSHASEMDFCVMYNAILPYKRANNVVAIDAIRDHGDWLMRSLGCICKRKFIRDLPLVRNIKHCLKKYGDIVCMYPEARYSLDGCRSYIPPAVGKLAKLLAIPVVTLKMDGNFIIGPQWNKTRQVLPLHAEIKQIVTAEEVTELTAAEINDRILKNLEHDDFAYQRDNNILNKYPKRAEGLHNLLYRCPHCNTEFETYSEGTKLWCAKCGKEWNMEENGQLTAVEGETYFSHIPDWFNWQRKLVREEVRSGKYLFDEEVEVHTLPSTKRFYSHGRGRLTQTAEKTVLTCTAYGEPTEVEWKAAELESAHIEYDYPFEKKKYKNNIFGDCIDLSVEDESYWLHPVNKRTQITKFSLATEEIHSLALEKLKS